MRILVANALFPPLTTGSSHFTLDLAVELQSRGHEVRVVTAMPPGERPDDRDPAVPVLRLPSRWVKPGSIAFNYAIPVTRRGGSRRISQVIAEFKPDVVTCHGQVFDLSWRAARAAHRAGVPVTVTVHSAIRHTTPAADAVLRIAERLTSRPAFRPTDPQWIAVDKRTFDHAADTYHPSRDHLHFVPVVLRAEHFTSGDAEQARKRFSLGDGPLMLSLGHVVPVRDRVALVRALPQILDRHPDLKLVIVGELYTSEFRRVATELGVERSIITTGRVPHDCIADLLAASSLEIHDLQGIGLGITTLEAMAASVPVVAFVPDDNYPGLSMTNWPDLSLLPDVEPRTIAAAVVRTLDDDEHRQRVVDEQHRFIDSMFSPTAVASSYERVFAQAISEG
jgi:1,2-diacylglycerol 3-alpha-glucosyltransferase